MSFGTTESSGEKAVDVCAVGERSRVMDWSSVGRREDDAWAEEAGHESGMVRMSVSSLLEGGTRLRDQGSPVRRATRGKEGGLAHEVEVAEG